MDKRITSTVEGLLNKVPGYAGYRDKENRRDDDRRLRESIADSLDATVQTLTRANARLAERRSFTHLSTIERLIGTTRMLADRVRTTSYGYGGIFTEQSVDEFALEQLRQFDVQFEREVTALATIAERIGGSPAGPLETDIDSYQDELNRLGLLFDGRKSVVETAKPNRDAAVLALLEQNPVPAPSPLVVLVRGDTLSIGNDNYLVDATVTLTSPVGTVRLSRIGTGAEGKPLWVLGSNVAGQSAAKLIEQEPAGELSANARGAELSVDAGDGDSEPVAAQYAYTAGEAQGVSFWYAVGDSTRAFSGETLEESDVIVYGQA